MSETDTKTTTGLTTYGAVNLTPTQRNYTVGLSQSDQAPASDLAMSLKRVVDHLISIPVQAFLYDFRFGEFLHAWKIYLEEMFMGRAVSPDVLDVWHINESDSEDSENKANVGFKLAAFDVIRVTAEMVGHPIRHLMDKFWVFNGKHWEQVEESQFTTFLKFSCTRIGVPRIRSADANFQVELKKQFRDFLTVEMQPFTRSVLNFQNGTLTVQSNGELELRAHDPLDQLTYVLPYAYDPNARCERWLSFLDDVIPEAEKQANLAEFLGSCFHSVKHEKVLFLYGSGANGKSVVMEVIKRLFGERNLSHTSLEQLGNTNSYYVKDLMESLLNYSGEISERVNPEMLKRLSSREPLTGRLPGGVPFKVIDYARLAFNANLLPTTSDISDGFFRRLLIIPFEKTIPVEQRNPHLPDEIAETDLPGIINWVIQGLLRLLSQHGKFTPSESSDRMLREYRNESNPVEHFVEYFRDTLLKGVGADDLYTLYRGFCGTHGYSLFTQKVFSKNMINYTGIAKVRGAKGLIYKLID